MATFSSVTPQHVLQAIAEYDERGADDFLALYGFGPSRGYELIHDGRSYDSKAILGVAHRNATGRLATPEEFHGGAHGAADVLRKRGFEVTEPVRAVKAVATPVRRTTTTSTRRPAVEDRPLVICPTCFTALPATGVCDSCG